MLHCSCNTDWKKKYIVEKLKNVQKVSRGGKFGLNRDPFFGQPCINVPNVFTFDAFFWGEVQFYRFGLENLSWKMYKGGHDALFTYYPGIWQLWNMPQHETIPKQAVVHTCIRAFNMSMAACVTPSSFLFKALTTFRPTLSLILK
jgi:hypothetical protein